ncbi:hypothetical protein BDV96DRAFT_593549 [Lophiotrema nucula]|uniref:Uncharacterized protein n=1 Tax=Lophiotrema nucula TaxID=690887 RepID=A0A6A5ZXI0_9PLEO|nr:hypothetical protein BDV96DRAFT_593549 [Lophiotrema nucula]
MAIVFSCSGNQTCSCPSTILDRRDRTNITVATCSVVPSVLEVIIQRVHSICKVDLLRRTGDEYSATCYNSDGKEPGSGKKALTKDGDKLILYTSISTYENLAIFRTGEMGKGGTKRSWVDFRSTKSGTGDFSNHLTDFDFSTESQGWDSRYKEVEGTEPLKGYYCDVPDIEDDESSSKQTITCYYPCIVTS